MVAGGPHVTIFPKETATLEHIDFALAGEAEFSFINLVKGLENKSELTKNTRDSLQEKRQSHTQLAFEEMKKINGDT